MDSDDKAIVFVDRKATWVPDTGIDSTFSVLVSRADSIASELIRKRISCQSIHGDR